MTDEQHIERPGGQAVRVDPLTSESSTSDEVRQMLQWAGASDAPSREQLDRLAARVAPAVGLPLGSLSGAAPPYGPPPAGLSSGGTSLPPAAPLATGAKVAGSKLGLGTLIKVVGLAGAVGIGAVGYGAITSTSTPAAEPAARAPMSATAPAHAPEPAIRRELSEGVDPEPTVSAQMPAEEPVEAPPAEVEAAAGGKPAPRTAAARQARSQPRAQPVQREIAPSAPVAKPSELDLMDRAQAERGQPARMLRTLREHAKLYPTGMLAQERDVLRIEALVELGRRAQAQTLATSMERSHPGSPHLRRVRALLQGADGAH